MQPRWVSWAPLGFPVVPEVKMHASSSGSMAAGGMSPPWAITSDQLITPAAGAGRRTPTIAASPVSLFCPKNGLRGIAELMLFSKKTDEKSGWKSTIMVLLKLFKAKNNSRMIMTNKNHRPCRLKFVLNSGITSKKAFRGW